MSLGQRNRSYKCNGYTSNPGTRGNRMVRGKAFVNKLGAAHYIRSPGNSKKKDSAQQGGKKESPGRWQLQTEELSCALYRVTSPVFICMQSKAKTAGDAQQGQRVQLLPLLH